MCGMRQKKANAPGLVRGLLLVALGAAGVVGCSRETAQEDAPPPYVPESYMNDPEFRGKLKEQRQARNKIVNARAAVVAKMREIEQRARGDAAVFENDPGWKALKSQLEDLNARYDAARREQLEYVRGRVAPKK